MIDTVDYEEIAAETLEAIHEAGQGMVLYRPESPGTYDPITDEYEDGTPEQALPFYGLNGEISTNYAARVGTGNIQMRDRLIYADAVNIAPTLDDFVYVMGEQWSIVNIEPVSPAGTPVLYELHVRP